MIPPLPKTPLLDARGVSKRFGAVAALKDASLQVGKGEVVALMGANGAGKSTLVKILTGALGHDGGQILIHGRAQPIGSPRAARRAGLVPVYQEPSLIPDLDLAQNLALGATPVGAFRHWAAQLGLPDLTLDTMINRLPLASLRIVDLARALAAEPDVLLLDEMTAALPADLVHRVLSVVRAQADAGRAVIYISHRFTEISALCDRATVLRDGVTVGDLPIKPGVEERIVDLMLGEGAISASASAARTQTPAPTGARPRLCVRALAAGTKLTDVSFDLHAGEVLGVVALEGQGQDELFAVLAGARKALRGAVQVNGAAVQFAHPADAIAMGLSFVPGERAHALLMQRSVRENIALPLIAAPRNWGPINMAAEAVQVSAAIARLQIDTRAMGEVQRLSGGNQQKVTIARWVAKGAETLLLLDPTRGIDVRTKRQIYDLVRDLADQGAAVLYYTSELAEIRMACDRAIVIFGGRVVDKIEAADADDARLMRAAYGLTEAEGAAR